MEYVLAFAVATALWLWLRHRSVAASRSRPARFYEFHIEYDANENALGVIFPVRRRLAELTILHESLDRLPVEGVSGRLRDEPKPLRWSVKSDLKVESTSATRITLAAPVDVTRIAVKLAAVPEGINFDVRCVFVSVHDSDLETLTSAYDKLEYDRPDQALEEFRRYDDIYSGSNPYVAYQIANLCHRRSDYRLAAEYALRTATSGFPDAGIQLFRQIREEAPGWLAPGEIASLEKESAEWDLAPHYGIVVLGKRQEFVLGLGGHHYKRFSEVILIRRKAAARMFTRLRVPYTLGKDVLLHSALRIIHNDETVEPVSLEHFTTADADSKNVYITHEEDKEGVWILPDLDVGDVIEWSYDLLRRDPGLLGKPHPFILTTLAHQHSPTYLGTARFEVPEGIDARFATLNMTPREEREKGDKRKRETFEFRALRTIPAKNTGFFFENNYLNPLVACTGKKATWGDVASDAQSVTLGDLDAGVEAPKEFLDIFSDGSDPEQGLRKAFYMIRDRIKYGSLVSAHKSIGKPDRAGKILTAGVGDCKDKTYLLALACRHLGVEAEPVLISSKEGLVVGDLAADQFDHIFLRARPGDRWLYLDAAGSHSVFGSAPYWCQGLEALSFDGGGSVVTIPEDDPERNGISISERVHGVDGDWLLSEVVLKMTGHVARTFDEHWKSLSLAFSEPLHAARIALSGHLPDLEVSHFGHEGDTSSSDECVVRCRGRRGPVALLGVRSVAQLSWGVPSLPLDFWRLLDLDRMFAFLYPMVVDLELTLGDAVASGKPEVSAPRRLENAICTISADRRQSVEGLVSRRRIIVKKKLIGKELVAQLPPAFEAIERAVRVAVSFESPARRPD